MLAGVAREDPRDDCSCRGASETIDFERRPGGGSCDARRRLLAYSRPASPRRARAIEAALEAAASALGRRERRFGGRPGKLLAELFEALAEPHLLQPDLRHRLPGRDLAARQAQARRPEDWPIASSSIVGGMELANAFSELNDPDEQRAAFRAQVASGRRARVQSDEDYVAGARARHAADGRRGDRHRPARDALHRTRGRSATSSSSRSCGRGDD